MAADLIPFPGPDAEGLGDAVNDRMNKLYDWADKLLERLGYAARVLQASSFDDLRKIVLDVEDAYIALAIRDALHPVSGHRAEHFVGLKAGALKQVLKARLVNMKKDREAKLLRGRTGTAGAKRYTDWTQSLKLDDEGGVRPLLANLILYLCNHRLWKGVLAYDEFNARVVIRNRPPWSDEVPDAALTDHHESLIRVWFQRDEDIAANQGDVGRAVQAAAQSNRFHPVREYFDALIWDGTPRIDSWLVTYLRADDTPYARAVGPRFLISAVARIYEPGCKADHMLVLEGPQGKQKSEALRTLAVRDAWFTDRLSHVASKDAAQETAGVMLIEAAEMDALVKATTSSIKSFVTRRHDRFRPPYGKHLINRPRQCVFAGTINPPAGGYLKDPTGARRFWPVACHGMIDRAGIERDCDQLWAEAIARFKAGAKGWLETPELEALAAVEQAARFKIDVWQEPITKWLSKRKDTGVSEVLKHVLGMSIREQSRAAEMRVASILTNLGFTKHRARKGNKRENRYWRE